MTIRKILAAVLGIAVSAPALAGVPLDYRMPYAQSGSSGLPEKGLTLVDSADFAQTTTVLPTSTAIRLAHINYGGEISDATYKNMRPLSVVYQSGGRFNRVDLRSSDSNPHLLSSEAGGNAVCDAKVLGTNLANPAANLLLYRAAGADAKCSTSDDAFRYVRLDAGADTAPSTAGVRTLDVYPLYDNAFAFKGLIALDGSTLKSYKTDLSVNAELKTGVTTFHWLARNAAGETLIQTNSDILRVSVNGTLVSGTLASVGSGYSLTGWENDGASLFWIEDAATPGDKSLVRRVPMDGSSGAKTVFKSKADQLALGGLTNKQLVYVETSFDTSTFTYKSALKAIDKTAKSGDPAAVTLHKASNAYLYVIATDATRVFYNLMSFDGDIFQQAFVRKADGTLQYDYAPGSAFALGIFATSSVPGTTNPPPGWLMLTEGASDGFYADAKLSSFKLSSDKKKLTNLPGNTGAAFMISPTPVGLGMVYLSSGNDMYSEVFAADAGSGAFLQETSSPTTNEVPVY